MLQRTPLHGWHLANGAQMTEFAGWDMPLHYGSILKEHEAVRARGGLFDLCHMARIRVRGDDRLAFLQTLLPTDLEKVELGAVVYSFFLNERGGVLDDVTIYKAEDYVLVVANGVNRGKIVAWLTGRKGKFDVEIEDATDTMGMIAIQGPLSESILQRHAGGDIRALSYYHFTVGAIAGARTLISRTGYTGEDGFELYCGGMYLKAMWDGLVESGRAAGVVPCGLGSRDLLRLEAAMPLYGHELTEDTTPLDAGLARFVTLDKARFIGRDALLHSTNSEFSRRLICFEMTEKAVPRAGATIYFEGMMIGSVTSGAFSPSLNRGVGMGYVDAIKTKVGTPIAIDLRGKLYQAQIVKRPFYRRQKTQ